MKYLQMAATGSGDVSGSFWLQQPQKRVRPTAPAEILGWQDDKNVKALGRFGNVAKRAHRMRDHLSVIIG